MTYAPIKQFLKSIWSFWQRWLSLALLFVFALSGYTFAQDQVDKNPNPGDSVSRLTAPRRLSAQFMERLDRDRAALATKVKNVDVPYPLQRGTFHFHSHFSHDSNGTIEEIIAAAKATGTRVIGFTEHPSREVNVVAENVSGWKDGVYFLAGTESSNQLHWPEKVNEAELRFVCHPEEVSSFERVKYDGIEIYNTHSDAKDEPINMLLLAMVMNLGAVREHPESAFCSFLDWPEEFLMRFDRLTTAGRFSGIAGNDSHQNQSLEVAVLPGGAVEVLDYTGDVVWQDDGVQAKLILAAMGQTADIQQRKVIASVQLDPYEISMRHVGTFLQIDSIDEKSVRQALREGRIILGFELIAPLPSVGFWVEKAGEPVATVGDELPFRPGMKLRVVLPAEAQIRLISNGKRIMEVESAELQHELKEPGVYRMEALQTLADQQYPWVISNPIYLVDEN